MEQSSALVVHEPGLPRVASDRIGRRSFHCTTRANIREESRRSRRPDPARTGEAAGLGFDAVRRHHEMSAVVVASYQAPVFIFEAFRYLGRRIGDDLEKAAIVEPDPEITR